MNIKSYEHNPPHKFIANTKYFITSSTYNKSKLLTSEESKLKLLEYIKRSVENYNWKLEDWVILDNHYHLMLESDDSPESLGNIIGNIHKYSAIWIKKNVSAAEGILKVWHNYWDKCLTFESSYYTRLNYIWYNPVKHGYVDEPQKWKFGSYYYRYKTEKEYMDQLEIEYPFNGIEIEDDY